MSRNRSRALLPLIAPIVIVAISLAVEFGGGGSRSDHRPARAERQAEPAVTAAGQAGSVYWGAWIDGDHYRRAGETPWNDAPWDRRSWARFERAAGKPVSILHFGQPAPWAQRFERSPLALTRRRGAIPLVDMDTIDPDRSSGRRFTLRQIASGARDRHLRAWALAAARYGSPFFLRLDWEMNGSWFKWGEEAAADPAAFVAAWRRFHDIAEAQGATNVTWVWCPNVVFDGSTPLRRLYPGGDYVDWTCMDGYNHGDHGTHPSGWVGFGELFGRTYAALLELAPRKPIMIGETASTEVLAGRSRPAAKAAWIADALRVQLPRRFPRVKAIAWFNWGITATDASRPWDWPIESSAPSRRAFAKAIGSRYYIDNRFGRLPAHRPVRPPR